MGANTSMTSISVARARCRGAYRRRRPVPTTAPSTAHTNADSRSLHAPARAFDNLADGVGALAQDASLDVACSLS